MFLLVLSLLFATKSQESSPNPFSLSVLNISPSVFEPNASSNAFTLPKFDQGSALLLVALVLANGSVSNASLKGSAFSLFNVLNGSNVFDCSLLPPNGSSDHSGCFWSTELTSEIGVVITL